MKTSLMQNGRYCYVCGSENALHKHNIFIGTSNKKLAEEDGAFCYLCYMHYNGGNYGLLFNKELDIHLKKEYQMNWENNLGTREDFINRYGKSWL